MTTLLVMLIISSQMVEDGGDRVAIVEVNHVVDSNGNDRFTQLIYREGNGLIRDWRYLQCQAMIPEQGCAVWRENGHWRMLKCDTMYETWTRTDPERDEAQWRPAHLRRRLFNTGSESE